MPCTLDGRTQVGHRPPAAAGLLGVAAGLRRRVLGAGLVGDYVSSGGSLGGVVGIDSPKYSLDCRSRLSTNRALRSTFARSPASIELINEFANSKSVGCSSDICVLQEHFTRVRHVCHILIGDPVECLDRVRGARRAPPNLPLEDSATPIELLQVWMLEEYAAIIAPLLRAVAARELESKVMLAMLKAWRTELQDAIPRGQAATMDCSREASHEGLFSRFACLPGPRGIDSSTL